MKSESIRDPIFQDDADRTRFLEILGPACAGTDWLPAAYRRCGALKISGLEQIQGKRSICGFQ